MVALVLTWWSLIFYSKKFFHFSTDIRSAAYPNFRARLLRDLIKDYNVIIELQWVKNQNQFQKGRKTKYLVYTDMSTRSHISQKLLKIVFLFKEMAILHLFVSISMLKIKQSARKGLSKNSICFTDEFIDVFICKMYSQLQGKWELK